MQVTKLYKAVAETEASHFQVNGGDIIGINTPEYEERKEYFIKGGYSIEKDYVKMRRVLVCGKLEKEITITINRPVAVNGEKLDEEESLCELCGEPLTDADGKMFRYHGAVRDCPKPPKAVIKKDSFVLYHFPSGNYSGRELQRNEVPAWTKASMDSFEKNFKFKPDEKDFVLAVIDWKNKNIQFEKLS